MENKPCCRSCGFGILCTLFLHFLDSSTAAAPAALRTNATDLEPIGGVESLQRVPEGQRCWNLSRGWIQLLAGHMQLLFLPWARLLITHSGEMPQVPRHGSSSAAAVPPQLGWGEQWKCVFETQEHLGPQTSLLSAR